MGEKYVRGKGDPRNRRLSRIKYRLKHAFISARLVTTAAVQENMNNVLSGAERQEGGMWDNISLTFVGGEYLLAIAVARRIIADTYMNV